MQNTQANSQESQDARQYKTFDDWLFDSSSDDDSLEELFAGPSEEDKKKEEEMLQWFQKVAEERRRREEELRKQTEEYQESWARYREANMKLLEERRQLNEQIDRHEEELEEARRGSRWTEEDDIEAGTRAGVIAGYRREIQRIQRKFARVSHKFDTYFKCADMHRVLKDLVKDWNAELKKDEKRAADSETWAAISDEVQKFSQMRVAVGEKIDNWHYISRNEFSREERGCFARINACIAKEKDLAKLFL